MCNFFQVLLFTHFTPAKEREGELLAILMYKVLVKFVHRYERNFSKNVINGC